MLRRCGYFCVFCSFWNLARNISLICGLCLYSSQLTTLWACISIVLNYFWALSRDSLLDNTSNRQNLLVQPRNFDVPSLALFTYNKRTLRRELDHIAKSSKLIANIFVAKVLYPSVSSKHLEHTIHLDLKKAFLLLLEETLYSSIWFWTELKATLRYGNRTPENSVPLYSSMKPRSSPSRLTIWLRLKKNI